MKHSFLAFFVFCAFFIPWSIVRGEEIVAFNAQYNIHADGRVRVVEDIVYDFGSEDRHGIFRTIPTTKTNTEGKQYRLDFDDFSVTNKANLPYRFQLTNSSGQIELKIGDPDSTVTGIVDYRIAYTVSGALTYFSDHDELYWNVTGDRWDIPIASSQATITLPTNVTESSLQLACYTGVNGSSESQCQSQLNGTVSEFVSNTSLRANEGLTVVVGFPKNIVAVLEPEEVTSLFDNPFVVLLFVLAGLAWYIGLPVWIVWRWWKQGRDPKSIVGEAHVWFSAPKFPDKREITPAELSLLLHEHVEPKGITGTIIDLAHKGYITIKKEKTDIFTLTRTQKNTHGLLPHETTILDALFRSGESVSSNSLELFRTFETLKQSMSAASVTQGLFVKNPELQRTLYLGLSVLGLFTGNILLFMSSLVFGKNMPRRTQLGVDMKAAGVALKNFLVSQEHQLSFQAKEVFLFEKLLPYATALGVEKLWALRFKNMNVPKPEWYTGSDTFTTMGFVNGFRSSFRSVESGMTTTKSSTGHSSGFSGGFSGGGGGGGGGGSW